MDVDEDRIMSKEELEYCLQLVNRYDDYEEKLTASLMATAIRELVAEVKKLQATRSDG